jgi:hypothetical protein
LCIDGHCQHKSFFPLTEKELIGAVLIFIASAICNAAGMGGKLFVLIFTKQEEAF